jgi:hypothetical protein
MTPEHDALTLHDYLVGLNFNGFLVGFDTVADFNDKAHNCSLGDRFAELGHDDGNSGHAKIGKIRGRSPFEKLPGLTYNLAACWLVSLPEAWVSLSSERPLPRLAERHLLRVPSARSFW